MSSDYGSSKSDCKLHHNTGQQMRAARLLAEHSQNANILGAQTYSQSPRLAEPPLTRRASLLRSAVSAFTISRLVLERITPGYIATFLLVRLLRTTYL
jgi:hypothetical protein